jgi:uncharacterized membrane protein
MLKSETISRTSPSTVVNWPRDVGGRVSSSSGIEISHVADLTIWRSRSDRSRMWAVTVVPSSMKNLYQNNVVCMRELCVR